MELQIDPQRVEDRKAGRKLGEEIVELVESLPEGNCRWWCLDVIKKRYFDRLVEPMSIEKCARPMAPREAAAFREEPMPFGKYGGYSIDHVEHVDPEYLDYLLRNDNPFIAELRRYMAREAANRD